MQAYQHGGSWTSKCFFVWSSIPLKYYVKLNNSSYLLNAGKWRFYIGHARTWCVLVVQFMLHLHIVEISCTTQPAKHISNTFQCISNHCFHHFRLCLSCLSNSTWCSETHIINLSGFVVLVVDGWHGVCPTRPPWGIYVFYFFALWKLEKVTLNPNSGNWYLHLSPFPLLMSSPKHIQHGNLSILSCTVCLSAPLASSRHSLPKDGPAGSAFHRLPGSPQGSGQLHQDRGEGDDPRRDDPEGEGECIRVWERSPFVKHTINEIIVGQTHIAACRV